MKNFETEKIAEREFRKFARQHLLKPGKCKRIDHTIYCIYQMHIIIKEFKVRFNYVPVSAHLMFNKYKEIQDRLVYENFRESYQNVLC